MPPQVAQPLPQDGAAAVVGTCGRPCPGGLCFEANTQITIWCVIILTSLLVYYGNQWWRQRKNRPKVLPNGNRSKGCHGDLEAPLLYGGEGDGDSNQGPVSIATETMKAFCAGQVSCGVTGGLEAASLAVLSVVQNRYRYSGVSIGVLSEGQPKVVDVEPTEKEMSFTDLLKVADDALKAAASSPKPGEESVSAEMPEVIFAWNCSRAGPGQWAVKQEDTKLIVEGSSREEERSFQILFEACAADPEKNIWQLPLLSEYSKARTLAWGKPSHSFSKERDSDTGKLRPIPTLLREKQVSPTAVAVAGEGFSITYDVFRSRANAVTAAVKAKAPNKSLYEKSVILCMGRGEMIGPAFVGVLQAGFTIVPVDVSWPDDRICCVIEDSKSGLVLIDAASESKWNSIEGPQVNDITPVLVGQHIFKEYMAEADSCARDPIDQADIAVILFTSGSTGRPKGILLSHGYLTALITGVADSKEITSESKTLLYHSPTWMPFLDYLLCPLLHGGCCLFYPETSGHAVKPVELSKFAHAQQATCLGAVPAVLDILLETDQGLPESMKQVGCGGALVPEELCLRTLSKVQNCIMTTGYSGTEQGDVTQAKMQVDFDVHCVANGKGNMTAGRPHTGQRIAILDRGQQLVSVGAIGEVTISGPGLASGYLALPKQTEEYFVPCAVMDGVRSARTGDLGRWDKTGNLEIVGRTGSMVKVRGARVDLGEVETAVLSHPVVTACAVIVHEDKLVAFAVPAVPGDLRDYLKKRMVAYMVPHVLLGLDELPKLPNGKINKKALKVPEQQEGSGETVMELDSLGQMRTFTRQNAAEDVVLDNVRAILIGVIIHGHNIPVVAGKTEMYNNLLQPLHAEWGVLQYNFLYLLVSGGWSSLAFLSGFDDTRAQHKGYGLTYREVLFMAIWLLFGFNHIMWYFPAFVFMRLTLVAAHKFGLEMTHIVLVSQLWLIMPAFVDIYVGFKPAWQGTDPPDPLNPPQDKFCPSECFCPFETWPWFQPFSYYTAGYWNFGIAHSWLGHGLIFIPCYWIGLYSGKYVFPLLTKLANEPSWARRLGSATLVLILYFCCFTILGDVTAGYDDRCKSFWDEGQFQFWQIVLNLRYFAMNLGMSLLYVVFIAAACPVHLKYLAKISFSSLIFSDFFACIMDLGPIALLIRSAVPSFVSPVLEIITILAVPFTFELVFGVIFTTVVAWVAPPIVKLFQKTYADWLGRRHTTTKHC